MRERENKELFFLFPVSKYMKSETFLDDIKKARSSPQTKVSKFLFKVECCIKRQDFADTKLLLYNLLCLVAMTSQTNCQG